MVRQYWSSDDTLTCSDIVLHVSSELYIVPTNIYVCTVITAVLSLDATYMVSWNHSVVHVHSIQVVWGLGEGMVSCREWGGGCNGPCLRQNVASHFHIALIVIPINDGYSFAHSVYSVQSRY